MKFRPSSPLELPSPAGNRLDFDISNNPTLCAQAQATTTTLPRATPSALVSRLKYRTSLTFASSETGRSYTMLFCCMVSFPLAAAGTMWTSYELYFATTSHPDMQFPQKWQAGRAFVGLLKVALRT